MKFVFWLLQLKYCTLRHRNQSNCTNTQYVADYVTSNRSFKNKKSKILHEIITSQKDAVISIYNSIFSLIEGNLFTKKTLHSIFKKIIFTSKIFWKIIGSLLCPCCLPDNYDVTTFELRSSFLTNQICSANLDPIL